MSQYERHEDILVDGTPRARQAAAASAGTGRVALPHARGVPRQGVFQRLGTRGHTILTGPTGSRCTTRVGSIVGTGVDEALGPVQVSLSEVTVARQWHGLRCHDQIGAGDQSKQVNPAALRGPEGLVMWLRVYPAPAEKGGGVSIDHGHTIARETCVHRQACKHAEHAAWSEGMEPQGARG